MKRGFYLFNQAETYFEVVPDEFRVHKDSEIILPTRAHTDDAGYDLYSPVDVVVPGADLNDDEIFKSVGVWLDVRVRMPINNFLLIAIRSGLGTKTGLSLNNMVSIIDSRHYHNKENGGNILVKFRNFSKKPYNIKKGDRIAQGIILPYGVVIGDRYGESSVVLSSGLGGTGR